jgi:hypothetical protein
MAKTRFDIPEIPAGVARPIYAGVGVTDRVVEALRAYMSTAQKSAQERVADVQKTVAAMDHDPQALRAQVTAKLADLAERGKTVGQDADVRRRVVEERMAALQTEAVSLSTRLQKLVEEQVAGAGDTYDAMVKRGETLVGRIIHQAATQEAISSAETTVAKAKTTKTQAAKTAKKTGSSARKTASTARKTAAKSPAKSSAKATATSATETAKDTAEAVEDAAKKIGD